MLALARVGLLSALVASAAPPPAAQPAPAPRRVILRDSVSDRSGGALRTWNYRVVELDAGSDWWIETRDPYGGRVLMPLIYHEAVLSDAVAQMTDATQYTHITITRRSLWSALALIVFGLTAVVGAPVLWLQRRVRQERERHAQLQQTARQLAESREDERLRIARDLHDGPLQDLQALHLQMGIAASEWDGGDGTGLRRLKGAVDDAHSVIGELRGIAEQLRPPALVPFGLSAALSAHVDRLRLRHPGLVFACDLDDDGQQLPLHVRNALFRIAQEAINNAIKHGRPSRLALALSVADDEAELRIVDDGVGFEAAPDFGTYGATGHYGLLGMRERADAIGGTYRVESLPEQGTQITVRVPLADVAVEA